MSDFDRLVVQYNALREKGTNSCSRDELDKYKTKVLKYLAIINGKIATHINIFNTLVTDLTNLITKDFPNKLDIKTYGSVILDVVEKDPSQPISLFITQIYANDEYRTNILAMNDAYFEGESFGKITQNEDDKVMILGQIKSCWHELSLDRKEYIKMAMKTMMDVSDFYLKCKDEGNDIRDMVVWIDGC